jgi:Cytochrome bd terminal oxidase subunit II
MFSGFYLAFLLLVALIARGVSFEFRGRRDSPRWQRDWALATTGGSLLAPLLIGVALGNLLHGVPIGSDQEYAGTFTDLLNPYSLFCGLTVVLLCLSHGASFLALKTTGEVRDRAMRAGRLLAPVAAAAVVGFAVWTWATAGRLVAAPGAGRPGRRLAGGPGPRRRRLHHHRGHHGRGGGVDLRRPLPPGHGLHPWLGQRPHRHQHLLGPVHAQGDDRRRGRVLPGRPAYQAWTYYVFRSRVGASGPSADADAGLAPRGP